VSVFHGNLAEILLGRLLAAGSELRDGARLRGLGRLSAGVGIDFGIEDEDVDVQVVRDDMIESAVADIIGPAVAADDPGSWDPWLSPPYWLSIPERKDRIRRNPCWRPESGT
jgi:hypothetical protein